MRSAVGDYVIDDDPARIDARAAGEAVQPIGDATGSTLAEAPAEGPWRASWRVGNGLRGTALAARGGAISAGGPAARSRPMWRRR